MGRAMKDSGVEWIGKIPEEWELLKIKNIASIGRGASPRPIDAYFSDEQNAINWIKIGDTIKGNKYICSTKQKITSAGAAKSRVAHAGDLLLTNSMSFGEPYILAVDGCIHDGWVCITPSDIVYKEFLYYFLLSDICMVQFRNSVSGGVVQNLNTEKIGNTYLLLPPLYEQKRIVSALDVSCAKIDEVLENTRSSIEEYKRLKQAIITQAVTKGVRGNRPMKDSGIEWAGEVPVDWNVQRIKTIFSMRDEKNYLPLEEVNLISLYTELGVVQHTDLENTTGNKASNADGYKKVYENDIVVNIILCWMGAIGRSAYNGVTSPAYDIYVPSDRIDCHFYHYYFRTPGFSGDCYKNGRGIMAMRWRTYSDEFRCIKVVVPPKGEQTEIAAYLDEKCAEIDALVAQKEQLLSELENYKKSLIYEYVTGKKIVSGQ